MNVTKPSPLNSAPEWRKVNCRKICVCADDHSPKVILSGHVGIMLGIYYNIMHNVTLAEKCAKNNHMDPHPFGDSILACLLESNYYFIYHPKKYS